MTFDLEKPHITHRDGTVFQILDDDGSWDEEATAKAYHEYEANNPPPKSRTRKILGAVREAFRPT